MLHRICGFGKYHMKKVWSVVFLLLYGNNGFSMNSGNIARTEDEIVLMRQRLSAINEEMRQNLSIPLSRPCPIPNPGIDGFFSRIEHELKAWTEANLFKISPINRSRVIHIIEGEIYESLESVGTLAGQRLIHETNVRNMNHSHVNKLVEECLMSLIEESGRNLNTRGDEYYRAALKRIFFMLFHSEMIGKEFQPGYLKPGDDPEVMCRGDWRTWCARERGD